MDLRISPGRGQLGERMAEARWRLGLTQGELGAASGLSQSQVSLFESGERLPALDQFLRIARALDAPLQQLINGEDRPGSGLADLAVELRRLGLVDLVVAGSILPGAARRPEEVLALAIAGDSPEPRVVEAIPALLSWNPIDPRLLLGFARSTATTYRLAWLADVALTIDIRSGFPGGCNRMPLARFVRSVRLAPERQLDDLGRPVEPIPTSPLWRRWMIGYGATIEDFERRAASLSIDRSSARSKKRRRVESSNCLEIGDKRPDVSTGGRAIDD